MNFERNNDRDFYFRESVSKKKEYFIMKEIFTPPSQREYDERVRHIGSLVLRDVLIAVVLLFLLGLFFFSLPILQSEAKVGYSLLPILAIVVAAITGLVSKSIHGGWEQTRLRRRSKILLFVGVPVVVVTLTVNFLLSGAKLPFIGVVIGPVLAFLLVSLFILFFSREKK
jgi:hypothetical protein